MLENLYTTKMSMDKKKLQNRFSKIRSKNGRISKLMALIIFAVILLVMACVTIIIAIKINPNGYYMTGNEFYDYINRPIGAVMADIDYADNNKIVFHYAEGFFIDNLQTEEIEHSINLKRLDIAYNQQGSSVLEIKVDKAGKYAYLSTVGPADEIKGYKKYIINLDNGEVQKGTMPENAELFTGIADTFTTVQNPVGWYSNNCIVSEEKTYYLTSQSGNVGDIQLVTIHHKDNNYVETKYLFSKDYVNVSQQKQDLIQKTLSDDEEILVNSVLSWEVNADVVKSVFNKLSETRQMKYIDVKDGNYDIVFYQIWKNDEATPRLFVIDNYNMELIFSMSLNKDEYFEINKLVYEAKEHNIETLTSADSAKEAVISFYEAFSKSDFEHMKSHGTENLPIDTVLKMCYGLTRAELLSIEEADNDEFLAEYLASDDYKLLKTLTDDEIQLLKQKSDVLKVYTVTVNAESNIKGEIKPPFEMTYNVICRKQPDTGNYLVDTFFG